MSSYLARESVVVQPILLTCDWSVSGGRTVSARTRLIALNLHLVSLSRADRLNEMPTYLECTTSASLTSAPGRIVTPNGGRCPKGKWPVTSSRMPDGRRDVEDSESTRTTTVR